MIVGIITVYVIMMIGLVTFDSSEKNISEEPEVVVNADIIMPTKASHIQCAL